jgi:hypothetical protein
MNSKSYEKIIEIPIIAKIKVKIGNISELLPTILKYDNCRTCQYQGTGCHPDDNNCFYKEK